MLSFRQKEIYSSSEQEKTGYYKHIFNTRKQKKQDENLKIGGKQSYLISKPYFNIYIHICIYMYIYTSNNNNNIL